MHPPPHTQTHEKDEIRSATQTTIRCQCVAELFLLVPVAHATFPFGVSPAMVVLRIACMPSLALILLIRISLRPLIMRLGVVVVPLLLLNLSSVARRACAAGATRLFIAVLASHRWSAVRRRLPSPQQRCLSSAERMCGASLWSGRHRRGVAALGREHMEVHIMLVVCPLQRLQLWQVC